MIGNILFRQKRGKALRSAFTLSAPRGEFSIVIVKAGVDIGAVSSFLFPLIGIISIITAFLSPFLVKQEIKYYLQWKRKKMSDELNRLLEQVHDGITTFNFDGKETPCIIIEEKKYDELLLSKVAGQSLSINTDLNILQDGLGNAFVEIIDIFYRKY